MTRVMANGTFDILHPGHVHYLTESAALGDELYVVIARDSRITAKKGEPVLPEDDRRTVVEALDCVDRAVLGSEGDIFDTVEKVQPDIITLGYDQPFDKDELQQTLREKGFDTRVVRIGKGGEYSSSELKNAS